MPKKVNLDVENRVIDLYKKNYNLSAIGREVDLHRHTVRNILKQRYGPLKDPDIKALQEEGERLQQMLEKKKAYWDYRSQIELYQRKLMEEKASSKTVRSMLRLIKGSDEDVFARTVVINLLRELERNAPRSFHNICKLDFNYDEILGMLWGSGKIYKDTDRLLSQLRIYCPSYFLESCKTLGIYKDDVFKLVKEAKTEELFYGTP